MGQHWLALCSVELLTPGIPTFAWLPSVSQIPVILGVTENVSSLLLNWWFNESLHDQVFFLDSILIKPLVSRWFGRCFTCSDCIDMCSVCFVVEFSQSIHFSVGDNPLNTLNCFFAVRSPFHTLTTSHLFVPVYYHTGEAWDGDISLQYNKGTLCV